MNKHQNEQIPLSQMLRQQSETSINVSNSTYAALQAYCVKHNVMIVNYVDSIIMDAVNKNQAPKANTSGSVK